MFDIKDYGAVAVPSVDNAQAIQRAIDACAAAGGGVVLVPPGIWGTKKITLKNNVELHMERGSELYSLLEPVPDPNAKCPEPTCNRKEYLIGAVKAHNVAITGSGRINGHGEDLFWNKNDGLEHPLFGQRYWPRLHRPKGLIHFRESTDIVIEGITIIDPPCYNIWLLACDRIDISRIRIDADLRGPNLDGIDLDCCSNARITGCDILAGDDGIALKSDIDELGYDKACENIVISDCRITTTSNGIRLGYEGDGAIRNIAINNCVIYDSMNGISLMVAVSPDNIRGTNIYKGAEITDVTFDNLVINAIQTFNFQYVRSTDKEDYPIQGYLDRIYFHNIIANANRGSYMSGVPESHIRTIEFHNVRMTLSGEMGLDFVEKVPNPYPVWSDLEYSGLPWPFFVRQADNMIFRDCTIAWENATGAWQSGMVKTESATVKEIGTITINQPEE